MKTAIRVSAASCSGPDTFSGRRTKVPEPWRTSNRLLSTISRMPRAAVPVERWNIRQSSRSVGIGDPGGYLPLTIIDSRYSTMSWKISFSGVRILCSKVFKSSAIILAHLHSGVKRAA